MRITRLGSPLVLALHLSWLLGASETRAQLKGDYVPGVTGLQSGSQAPPGISVSLPLYFYTTDDIRNDAGESIGEHPRVNIANIGPSASWVTNWKILGGNYGGSVNLFAFARSRIEGPSLDVPGTFQFTDISVQPIQLGWHTTRADFVATYGFYLPTGKWELEGSDNSGLGMWSHDFQGGMTLQLDKEQKWSFAALGTYEIHSYKKNTDIKVGDILTVEGGLGRTFQKMAVAGQASVPTLVTNVGAVYYAQLKVTSDQGALLTPLVRGRRDRVFAAGIEANTFVPKAHFSLGLRVEPEFGARNRTQGWTFALTAGYEIKSLVKHEPVAH